jgi:hypothetical protein
MGGSGDVMDKSAKPAFWDKPEFWARAIERARLVLTRPMAPAEFIRELRRAGIRCSPANLLAAGERRAWRWNKHTNQWEPIP